IEAVQQGFCIGDDNQSPDQDAQQAGGDDADQPGGDGSGNDSAGHQRRHPRPVEVFRPEGNQETEGGGYGDGKFTGVDGADHFSRFHFIAAEEDRCAQGSPPSAAGGIGEAGDQSQGDEQAGGRFFDRFDPVF